jgi:hypothetical protein
MVLGSGGMKAGFLAAIPLVAVNVLVALGLGGLGQFSQVIVDAIVTLVVCTILGFIISGLKKALFFVPISSPNLAMVLGLAVAGMLMYNDKSEVLVGHGVKQASAQYLGATLAVIIPVLAAGLFWGTLMGGIYSKTIEQQARSRPTVAGRLSYMLGLSRTQPAQVVQPATITVVTKDRCASCGKKVRGRLRSKVKIMECKRDNVVYCEECYAKFPKFGGITYTCPRCRGALAPVK